MFNRKIILLSLVVLSLGLSLGACSSDPFKKKEPDMEDAKFWQRESASSALYMQGPKAQQMLHQDMATCVVEIRELENLGEIRRAVPANYNSGNTIEHRTASQAELDEWDSPERDGYLYNEHLDYHDFETCMVAKGWERVEYLPYAQADKARDDYLKKYKAYSKRKNKEKDREYVTTLNPKKQNPPPYKDLNE